MDNVIRTIFGLLLRVLLLLMGLVFFLSVLAAGLLLLAVWLVRLPWAWLTGRPIRPWTFQIFRNAQWDRFYRAPGSGRASGRHKVDEADVIDVEPKRISAKEAPHDKADR